MKKQISVILAILFSLVSLSCLVSAEENKTPFVTDPGGIPPVTNERSIFGKDERGYISDPTVFPYKTIAKLVMYYPNTGNYPYYGTGYMYGPKSMATAAHNLYDASKGGYPTSVTAYFGASSSSNYVAKLTVTSKSNMHVPSGWINSGSMKYDYAALVFNTSPNVGSLGMQVVKDTSLESNQYSICGYAGKSVDNITNLWRQARSVGYMTSYTTDYLNFHIDMIGGQSGSPIYGADNKAIGIVTYNAGSDDKYADSSALENTANRFNSTAYNFLLSYRS